MASFLNILAVFVLAQTGYSFKCDNKIIKKIDQLWQGQTSTGLLKTFNKFKSCVVVASVEGLLPYEDHKCFKTTFDNGLVENTHGYENCTKKVFPKFKVVDLKNRDLYNAETKTHRIYLPFTEKDGVVGMYLCDDNGIEGYPRASIAVFTKDYSKKALEKAKSDLASLGMKMVKAYPDTCDTGKFGVKTCK